jgi:hypothetical protein
MRLYSLRYWVSSAIHILIIESEKEALVRLRVFTVLEIHNVTDLFKALSYEASKPQC